MMRESRVVIASVFCLLSLSVAYAQVQDQNNEPKRLVELRAKYKTDLEQLQRALAQAGDVNGAQLVTAEIKSMFESAGTVEKVGPQQPGVPETTQRLGGGKPGMPDKMQRLNGAWKVVRDSPEGKEAKGFVYFFVDHGRAPWDGWNFDARQKLWRVGFKRDGWANDLLVFDSMDGSALSGKIYPEGVHILMVPLNPAQIELPKQVSSFDGFWSYAGIGWSEIVLEFKNGRTVDGRYSLRLNEKDKTLELLEKGTKTPVQFLPVETDVWMGMLSSQIPRTIRRK